MTPGGKCVAVWLSEILLNPFFEHHNFSKKNPLYKFCRNLPARAIFFNCCRNLLDIFYKKLRVQKMDNRKP